MVIVIMNTSLIVTIFNSLVLLKINIQNTLLLGNIFLNNITLFTNRLFMKHPEQ